MKMSSLKEGELQVKDEFNSAAFDSRINSSQELLNIREVRCLDSFLIKKTKPFKVGPSSVLDKVKSFLPQMEMANKQLDERIAQGATLDLDIENIDDCSGPVIEMNLALCENDGSSDDNDEEEEDGSEAGESGSEEGALLGPNCDKVDLGLTGLSALRLPGKRKKMKDGRTLIELLPGAVSHGSDVTEGDKT